MTDPIEASGQQATLQPEVAPAGSTEEATVSKTSRKTNGGGQAQSSAGIERTPIWPDYFARLGQPDAANWQYQGYWSDTVKPSFASSPWILGAP